MRSSPRYTTNSKVKAAITRYKRAYQDFLKVVLEEMEKVARRRGLRKVYYGAYGQEFVLKSGKSVGHYLPLDAIYNSYLTIDKYGFIALWTPEEGWRF